MYVVNAQEMRELDRRAIQEVGIPAVVLMETAGRAVAQEVKRRRGMDRGRVTVLVGHGNNGGDGLVAARHLKLAGFDTDVWLIGKTERMGVDVQRFWNVCQNLNIRTYVYRETDGERLRRCLEQSDVVIDSLLGTGMTGAVRTPMLQVIQMLNRCHVPLVIAVDVPSGVDTDSGAVMPEAVRADCTVTFAFPKWCHYLAPAASLTGELLVADIGIPATLADNYPIMSRVTDRFSWSNVIRSRDAFSHKGTHGHVLVIGGKRGMAGAPVLTSRAVLTTGAGLVTTAVPAAIQNTVATGLVEGLTWGLGEKGMSEWHADTAVVLAEHLHDFDAIAVGPGLGRFPDDSKWLQTLLATANSPVILDADALNIVSDDRRVLAEHSSPLVMTPHPGEMARLIKKDIRYVEEHRPAVALQLAQQTGAIVVLKGRYTVTAFPDGRRFVNTTGSPAMAKGGSGDVLTGIIAAFIAQGYASDVAVPLAVSLHGYAGEMAANSHTEFSVLASDMVQQIGPALQKLMTNEHPCMSDDTFPGKLTFSTRG